MRKQILIVLLLSPQLFVVHHIKSMSNAELVSAVGDAMDAAAKDPAKVSKAETDLGRALQRLPDNPQLLQYKQQIAILKQIYDFNTRLLEIGQPKYLRGALDTLFTLWKGAALEDIRTRAYEKLNKALNNVIANAEKWDQEDLDALEVTIRAMKEDPVYSTTMSFIFRRMLDDAYNAVKQGLKQFPPSAIVPTAPMPYVPPSAPPITPTVTPSTPAPSVLPPTIYTPTPSAPPVTPSPAYTPVTYRPTERTGTVGTREALTPYGVTITPGAPLTQEQMHSELRRLKIRADWLRKNMPQ